MFARELLFRRIHRTVDVLLFCTEKSISLFATAPAPAALFAASALRPARSASSSSSRSLTRQYAAASASSRRAAAAAAAAARRRARAPSPPSPSPRPSPARAAPRPTTSPRRNDSLARTTSSSASVSFARFSVSEICSSSDVRACATSWRSRSATDLAAFAAAAASRAERRRAEKEAFASPSAASARDSDARDARSTSRRSVSSRRSASARDASASARRRLPLANRVTSAADAAASSATAESSRRRVFAAGCRRGSRAGARLRDLPFQAGDTRARGLERLVDPNEGSRSLRERTLGRRRRRRRASALGLSLRRLADAARALSTDDARAARARPQTPRRARRSRDAWPRRPRPRRARSSATASAAARAAAFVLADDAARSATVAGRGGRKARAASARASPRRVSAAPRARARRTRRARDERVRVTHDERWDKIVGFVRQTVRRCRRVAFAYAASQPAGAAAARSSGDDIFLNLSLFAARRALVVGARRGFESHRESRARRLELRNERGVPCRCAPGLRLRRVCACRGRRRRRRSQEGGARFRRLSRRLRREASRTETLRFRRAPPRVGVRGGSVRRPCLAASSASRRALSLSRLRDGRGRGERQSEAPRRRAPPARPPARRGGVAARGLRLRLFVRERAPQLSLRVLEVFRFLSAPRGCAASVRPGAGFRQQRSARRLSFSNVTRSRRRASRSIRVARSARFARSSASSRSRRAASAASRASAASVAISDLRSTSVTYLASTRAREASKDSCDARSRRWAA